MWKVKIADFVVFTSKTDIEAIQFALSFHQACNVSHIIQVCAYDIDGRGQGEVVCNLITA